MTERPGPVPEKRELQLRFIPILCSTPLIYAHASGLFARRGLRVSLKPVPGWSGIKELLAYDKIDAAHVLAPMPLACHLGIDGKQSSIKLALIQNVNGQALTLASKHRGIEHVSDMRGFTFGVPYRFSMHYYLLCHYLAQHGVDPLREVQVVEVAPPTMPWHLEHGLVDGILGPEPFNQIPICQGTGFIHVLSKEIWDGHPCCGFATAHGFAERYPFTYCALLESVFEAERVLHHADAAQRRAIARQIADPAHLDLDDPLPAVQVLSGQFPDGRGGERCVPDRIDFQPFLHQDHGSWMLSQMQRWNQLKRKIDYREVLESCFDSAISRELAAGLGYAAPKAPQSAVPDFDERDPYAHMRSQPFSAFLEERQARQEPALAGPDEERLARLNEQLALAVAGQLDQPPRANSAGELGRLEELLGELVLNTRFARQQLLDRHQRLRQERARVEQVNGVLRAIRGVNQLIVREKDPARLIQRACEILVEYRGFTVAWIFHDPGTAKPTLTHAGSGRRFKALKGALRAGDVPDCIRRALSSPGPVLARCAACRFSTSPCDSSPSPPAADQSCASRSDELDEAAAPRHMVIALRRGDTVFGALGVSVPELVIVDIEERDLLQEVADDIAFALHSAAVDRHHRQAQRERDAALDELQALLRATRAVLGNASSLGTLRQVYDECKELIGAQGGYVALRTEDEHNELVFLDAGGLSCTVDPRLPMPIRGLRARAYAVGTPVYDNAFPASPYAALLPSGHVALRNVMFVPMALQGEVKGVIGLANKPGGFDESDVTRAAGFGEIAAIALRNVHATEALARSERRFRLFFENSPEYCYMVAPEGTILEANQAAAAATGWSKQELLGRPMASLYSERSRPAARAALERWQREGVVRNVELNLACRGGTERSVLLDVGAIRNAQGELLHSIVIQRDITERKRQEQELTTQEERFRTIFHGVNDGILLADRQTRSFVLANRTICEMLGYSAQELSSMSVADIHPPQDVARIAAIFDDQARGGTALAKALPVQRADGSVFMADIAASPIILDGRELQMGCFRDVTEEHDLQHQLSQARRMESVGRLAGGVAHDFNNLLTVILTVAEFAAADLKQADPLHADLLEIASAAQRASHLTHQLLAFSRRQPMRPSTLDLNEVVRGLHGMLGRLLGEDIEIRLSLKDGLWHTTADASQVEQVLMNLVINARDAMPAGGKLTIETRNVELDPSSADRHVGVQPGSYALLAVSDDGEGMDPLTLEQVFEPFFSTKEKGRGTGLGLSTVYGIVKQSGGHIWIYSEPGRGTSVKIYFPRKRGPGKHRASVVPEVEELRGTETVLVVEDEGPVRRMATRVLERQGYTVLQARDGLEAETLARTARGPIHLLLTDVVMPGISGREAAERLQRAQPDLVVLYMSGFTDNAIVHHGVLDEGIELLEKPFTPDSLARRVRRLLDKKMKEGEE